LIIEGSLSREEVADWASEYVMQDEPGITDKEVWQPLQITSGVDLKDSPDEYLHVEQDIIDWINRFNK
jgi:hypothetical protein